jgi:hypothetical protein
MVFDDDGSANVGTAQQAAETFAPHSIELEEVDGPAKVDACSGEYGPYFTDYTSAAAFAWRTKHQICK